jgi:LmbE family N-acetylglucosaminyl deacetylase
MPPSIRVLALFAHPDDAEFLCAGTLVHLAGRGASIHIATLTAGDCGSSILPSAKITRLRRQEAQRSAALLHGEGFRQHLGQGFPQENLLAQLLGDLVRPARTG